MSIILTIIKININPRETTNINPRETINTNPRKK